MAALSCEERTETIVRQWWPSLIEALTLARDQVNTGPIAAPAVAWVTAYNISGGTHAIEVELERQGQTESKRKPKRNYIDDHGATTTLEELHDRLSRPMPAKGDLVASSKLAELTVSVACEQRGDWQHPDHRDVDDKAAKLAVGTLVLRYSDYVERYIRKAFRNNAGEPSEITAIAWSKMYAMYWSPEPRGRFRGKSRIVSTVCSIAYFTAIEELPHHGGGGALDAAPMDLPAPEEPPGLVEGGDRDRFREVYQACLEKLEVRRRQAFIMRYEREMAQKDVATVFGVTEARVSQLLKDARRRMKDCMIGAGFDPAAL